MSSKKEFISKKIADAEAKLPEKMKGNEQLIKDLKNTLKLKYSEIDTLTGWVLGDAMTNLNRKRIKEARIIAQSDPVKAVKDGYINKKGQVLHGPTSPEGLRGTAITTYNYKHVYQFLDEELNEVIVIKRFEQVRHGELPTTLKLGQKVSFMVDKDQLDEIPSVLESLAHDETLAISKIKTISKKLKETEDNAYSVTGDVVSIYNYQQLGGIHSIDVIAKGDKMYRLIALGPLICNKDIGKLMDHYNILLNAIVTGREIPGTAGTDLRKIAYSVIIDDMYETPEEETEEKIEEEADKEVEGITVTLEEVEVDDEDAEDSTIEEELDDIDIEDLV